MPLDKITSCIQESMYIYIYRGTISLQKEHLIYHDLSNYLLHRLSKETDYCIISSLGDAQHTTTTIIIITING